MTKQTSGAVAVELVVNPVAGRPPGRPPAQFSAHKKTLQLHQAEHMPPNLATSSNATRELELQVTCNGKLVGKVFCDRCCFFFVLYVLSKFVLYFCVVLFACSIVFVCYVCFIIVLFVLCSVMLVVMCVLCYV